MRFLEMSLYRIHLRKSWKKVLKFQNLLKFFEKKSWEIKSHLFFLNDLFPEKSPII